jgi:nucleoside-diphosphate-sugar epimerase
MKILLTGSTGYIGSNVLSFYKKSHDIFLWKRGYTFKEAVSFNPDLIIHSAGEIYNKEKMIESNILLTYKLVEAAEACKSKFIYIGSSSEYGIKPYDITENEPLRPTTLYGATKASGSLIVYSSSIPTIIARPFSVYGKNEPLRRFIPKVYNAIKYQKEINIYSGVHDFIHIDDFVKGIDLCKDILERKNKEIVNFGTGIQYSNLEIFNIMTRLMGKTTYFRILDKKLNDYDTLHWKCNPIYTRLEYGYKAKTTIEEGLEKYIRYRETTPEKNIRY